MRMLWAVSTSEVQVEVGRSEVVALAEFLTCASGADCPASGGEPGPWDQELTSLVVLAVGKDLVRFRADLEAGTLTVRGGRACLNALADQLRGLGDSDVPVGYHEHLDPTTGLYPLDPDSSTSMILTVVS